MHLGPSWQSADAARFSVLFQFCAVCRSFCREFLFPCLVKHWMQIGWMLVLECLAFAQELAKAIALSLAKWSVKTEESIKKQREPMVRSPPQRIDSFPNLAFRDLIISHYRRICLQLIQVGKSRSASFANGPCNRLQLVPPTEQAPDAVAANSLEGNLMEDRPSHRLRSQKPVVKAWEKIR